MINHRFLLVLLPFFCGINPSADADEIASPRQFIFGLESSLEQQEVYTDIVDLLAPSMGQWGQLGLQFGSKTYDYQSATGVRKVIPSSELGVVWHVAGEFLPHLSLATNLALGQSNYKSWIANELQNNSNVYFQLECFLEFVSSNKLAINIGPGVVLRDNFFSDTQYHFGGAQVIPGQVVGPALRIGIAWF